MVYQVRIAVGVYQGHDWYSYAPGLYAYADLMFVSSDSAGTQDNDGTVLLIGHVLSF